MCCVRGGEGVSVCSEGGEGSRVCMCCVKEGERGVLVNA